MKAKGRKEFVNPLIDTVDRDPDWYDNALG
jgi:hypothetical protein